MITEGKARVGLLGTSGPVCSLVVFILFYAMKSLLNLFAIIAHFLTKTNRGIILRIDVSFDLMPWFP